MSPTNLEYLLYKPAVVVKAENPQLPAPFLTNLHKQMLNEM